MLVAVILMCGQCFYGAEHIKTNNSHRTIHDICALFEHSCRRYDLIHDNNVYSELFHLPTGKCIISYGFNRQELILRAFWWVSSHVLVSRFTWHKSNITFVLPPRNPNRAATLPSRNMGESLDQLMNGWYQIPQTNTQKLSQVNTTLSVVGFESKKWFYVVISRW